MNGWNGENLKRKLLKRKSGKLIQLIQLMENQKELENNIK